MEIELKEGTSIYDYNLEHISFYFYYEDISTICKTIELAKKYKVSANVSFEVDSPLMPLPAICLGGYIDDLKKDIPKEFLKEIKKLAMWNKLKGYIDEIGFELDDELRIIRTWIPEGGG